MTNKASTTVYYCLNEELSAMEDLGAFFVEGDRVYVTDTHEWLIFDGNDLVDFYAPCATTVEEPGTEGD